MSLSRADVAKRVAVFLLAVLVVVGGAAAGATLLVPTPGVDNVTVPTYPEFDAAELSPERVDDTGTIETLSGLETGVVVIDRGHNNRFERGDITALENAIAQSGGKIRYLGSPGTEGGGGGPGPSAPSEAVSAAQFNRSLANADAFVIVNPGLSYSDDKIRALEEFIDSGGRLLVAGEPNYRAVEVSGGFARLVTRHNRLVEIGSQFGLAFGTEYLINMRPETNDGIYKNVRATGGESGLSAGVDEAVFFTATTVDPEAGGTPLLVGSEGTQLASAGGSGPYPVAALNAEGTVLGVGDTTFMSAPNHNVADNEVFLVRLVQFLAQGDADFQPPTTTTTTGGF